MKSVLIMMLTALALGGASPALAQGKGCPPGLAKKDPPCVPPGLAKKGVTAKEWSRGREYDERDDYRDDDDRAGYVYDRADPPRYLVRPNGQVVDLQDQRADGWRVIEGITDEDGMPRYVLGPNGRIYSVGDRLDEGWQLVDSDDVVRLPRREDGREFYLLDDEVVEIINRESDPYVRLLGALDDILN